MPIYVHQGLPAINNLPSLLTLPDKLALGNGHLKIGIVNLMPLKEMTEEDFLRLFADVDLDVDISWITMASHQSKNTSFAHISRHYSTFPEIKNLGFHGIIITGAPVEKLDFEDVDYWQELTDLMDWTKEKEIPTLYICWGAFAGLYHNHNIGKHILDKKISGVFPHIIATPEKPLFKDITGQFYVPHSRYASWNIPDITADSALSLLSHSEGSGAYIVEAAGGKELYITGHSEYAPDTLDFEYHRDLAKGINPSVPVNYYPDDDPSREPVDNWSVNARKLFGNWIKYYVASSDFAAD